MPATRKSFSRGANTKSSRPSTLSLSSYTSKSDPTAAHKASLAARNASKGAKGGKKHEGTKERDRQMMEDLNRGGDVGYKGRELFLAGLVSPRRGGLENWVGEDELELTFDCGLDAVDWG